MRVGKKLLSLLMGIAVLFVSVPSVFAADVGTTDRVSISYDYVTEFDDGGRDYVYIIDGVKNHYLVPPEDFDPLTATDEELDRYCFPDRPEAAVTLSNEVSDYSEWYSLMSNYTGTPEPEISISVQPVDPEPDTPTTRATSISFYNWSGYASDLGDSSSKFYTQAQMDYKQPTISSVESGAVTLNSYWIGFGGYNGSQKLVQAGTSTSGINTHKAWYEYLSDTGETVYMQYIDSLAVSAGDNIHVYIAFQKANDKFEYYIANNSTGKSASGYVELDADTQFDGTTVEWVVERCTVNGSLASLGNYGTMTLKNCKATLNSSNTWLNMGNLSGLSKMTMIGYSGNTLSSPGSISSGTQFTCTFKDYS